MSGPAFTIEKDVPIPPVKRSGGDRIALYPFRVLDIGDSFFVSAENVRAKVQRMASMAARHRHSTGRTFTVRSVEGGVRVWRTS